MTVAGELIRTTYCSGVEQTRAQRRGIHQRSKTRLQMNKHLPCYLLFLLPSSGNIAIVGLSLQHDLYSCSCAPMHSVWAHLKHVCTFFLFIYSIQCFIYLIQYFHIRLAQHNSIAGQTLWKSWMTRSSFAENANKLL